MLRTAVWRSLKRVVGDGVAPRTCAFCGTLCHRSERRICSACYAELPWRTSAPATAPFEVSVAPLAYEFPVDAAIKALKLRHQLWLAPALVELLEMALPSLPASIDKVVPVPLHWRRKAGRGFNQAEELAVPIAKCLGVPVFNAVRRRRFTAFQSDLSGKAREKNVRGAFSVRRPLVAQHALIVDDIITTGATSRSLARTLRAAGAKAVSVLAVAKT